MVDWRRATLNDVSDINKVYSEFVLLNLSQSEDTAPSSILGVEYIKVIINLKDETTFNITYVSKSTGGTISYTNCDKTYATGVHLNLCWKALVELHNPEPVGITEIP